MRSLSVIALLLLSSAPLQAADTLSLIRAAAVGASPFTEGEARLDPRVRVAPCTVPLQAQVTTATAEQATVQVGCTQPAWQLYVPVRAQGSAQVLVLARPLAAGERVGAEDIRAEPRARASLGYGALTDQAMVVGRQTRRALPAGRVLTPGDVLTPPMIRRGDTVTLVVDRGPVQIRMPGTALSDGTEGARIGVRNSRSGHRVEGIVRDEGRVEIPG